VTSLIKPTPVGFCHYIFGGGCSVLFFLLPTNIETSALRVRLLCVLAFRLDWISVLCPSSLPRMTGKPHRGL